MAKKTTTVDEPPVAPPEDTFGRELDESIAANEALLRGLKYEFGQALLQAQEGDGEAPPPTELVAIRKLEATLQNDKLFVGARALTRRRI